ncbi:c-type cytochrome [Ornithinimicrobium ciconiae]|uniref:Cytochrome bc1 complex cytochrome c subunit n=1 Tax=Ornithinimicrobium ciconiae TaxID=2594265 RepID=A0A516GA60_9MICO|nr:c-type cytochrome [Ornithinimicrobium ciconiae]QDO88395.1 c-type cytochrome [Ornithinimicrobium ciconiae]
MSKLAAYRRSPIALIVLLFLGLTFTGTAYAALQPTAPVNASAASNSTGAVGDAEEGEKLFLANCASCHGKNAEGNGTEGPSLVGVGSAAVDFQVGTGRMPLASPGVQAPANPNQVNFSDKQIEQMGAFIDSLGPGPGLPDAEFLDLVNADIANGGKIFRTNCAMCHNSSAQGGALTRGKYAPSLMNVDNRHMYSAMLTGPQSMPVFNDATITPQEKEDVIAFINNIEEGGNAHGGHDLGSLGPAGDALFIWTLGIGLFIAAAVWLGRKAA